ncbi:MAG: acyl carrier protein [Myxococcota bacterium]
MDSNEIQKQVREYVIENLVLGDEEDTFSDNQSFLDTGLIDSTGILEVIGYLEDEYEITIEDDEMVPENLDSVDRIARFVHAKQNA